MDPYILGMIYEKTALQSCGERIVFSISGDGKQQKLLPYLTAYSKIKFQVDYRFKYVKLNNKVAENNIGVYFHDLKIGNTSQKTKPTYFNQLKK